MVVQLSILNSRNPAWKFTRPHSELYYVLKFSFMYSVCTNIFLYRKTKFAVVNSGFFLGVFH